MPRPGGRGTDREPTSPVRGVNKHLFQNAEPKRLAIRSAWLTACAAACARCVGDDALGCGHKKWRAGSIPTRRESMRPIAGSSWQRVWLPLPLSSLQVPRAGVLAGLLAAHGAGLAYLPALRIAVGKKWGTMAGIHKEKTTMRTRFLAAILTATLTLPAVALA